MTSFILKLIIIISILVPIRSIASAEKPENLTNVAVVRFVTFTMELVEIKSEIVVLNNHKISAESYDFYMDPDVDIYHIGFMNKLGNRLNFTKDSSNNIYVVQFEVPLKHLERTTIIAKQIHVNKLISWFKTRKFNEKNIMQYSGNVNYYSKYQTLTAATQYYTGGKLAILRENGHSLIPTSSTNTSISFMFDDKTPFSQLNLKINFLCDVNYYRILNFERTVDISMYGMINIVDNVVLKNNGPKLVGPFEPSFIRDHMLFTTPLPYGAHSIKYYDEIGLIRSFEISTNKDKLSFDFKPRYPIHRGWKVSYSLKYLIPIYNYLRHSKEDNILELTLPAFGQVLKNVLMEKATVKILLPEGSSIIAVTADDELVRRGNRKVFSSLSWDGRKQVEFEANNILDSYDTNVQIQFKQPIFYFLRAPLLITSHLFALFLVVIFLIRYQSFGSH